MPEETQKGHEADLDSMDRAQFQAALSAKMSESGDSAGEDTSQAASTTAGDTKTGEEGKAPELKEPEDKQQPKPFKLTREVQPPATKPEGDTGPDGTEKEEELRSIIHNGQEIRVTESRFKNLAQQGYDLYHKVGKWQRIAQLMETDPKAAEMLDGYIKAKMEQKPFRWGQPEPSQQEPANPFERAAQAKRPQLRKLSEFDSEEEWLAANGPALIEMYAPKAAPEKPPTETKPTTSQPNPVLMRLQIQDPNYEQVISQIIPVAKARLTLEQIEEIDRNPVEFQRFYGWVREHELKLGPLPGMAVQTPPADTRPNPQDTPAPKPGFKARPGGGTLERENKDTVKKVWEMPSKDFRAYMDRVKNGEVA